MFGQKDKSATKEKKLSPKEIMTGQIETLETGKEMLFRLGPIYVKPFITIVHNPEYPGKGKKFIAYQEGAGPDSKPSGLRGKFYDTNNAKDIAAWVLEREGSIYKG
jgi:hypothetical protein